MGFKITPYHHSQSALSGTKNLMGQHWQKKSGEADGTKTCIRADSGAFFIIYFFIFNISVVLGHSGHKLNACEHAYWKIPWGKMELLEMICLLARCIGPLKE